MRALLSVTLFSVALAGFAGSAAADIELTDRGSFVGGLRVSIDIAPKGERPAVPRGGHGIEIGLSRTEGEDTQNLSSPVVFTGRTFSGALATEAEFGIFELAYRYRRFFGGGEFGIEALGGLAFAELDLKVASASQRAGEKLTNGGVVGGFGVVWHMRPDTSLQSRIALFASGRTEDVSSAARFDVYVAHAFARNVALRIGLAAWDVRSARDDSIFSSSSDSPIRVRLSGLAAGLDLAF